MMFCMFISFLKFFRIWHPVFDRGCTVLHSCQQCSSVAISLHLYQCVLFSVFLIVVILVFVCGGRSYSEAGMSAVDCKNFASSLSFVPVFMYNLDGGASTNFIEHGQRMNSLVDNTNRPVANFLSWISETAEDNGVFKSANTSDHKSLQNMRLARPMNIKSQISYNANVSGSLNTTVLALGNMITANIDFTVNTALSAYAVVISNLPHNATSDSHFIFRKLSSNDTTDLYIDNQGRLCVAGDNTLGTGRWFGTVIYSTDAGRSQSSNPE